MTTTASANIVVTTLANGAASLRALNNDKPPTKSIVVSQHSGNLPAPADTFHRAVHKIRLPALSHNFSEVESAADRQRCSVIVVVKADGYGHGAIATALYLADNAGADAFAVATLEEGIALRKAFQQTAPGQPFPGGGTATQNSSAQAKNHVTLLFHNPSDEVTTLTTQSSASGVNGTSRRRNMRSSRIRILVLGPPVGFPRCFDDYYHHSIEAMISGPEVAKALFEWVHNTEERKRTQVERAAAETKELALKGHTMLPLRTATTSVLDHKDSNASEGSTADSFLDSNGASSESVRHYHHPPSATLSNVTGSDLAKEVRKILKNQQQAAETHNHQLSPKRSSGTTTPMTVGTTITHVTSVSDMIKPTSSASAGTRNMTTQVFAGLEDAAKKSRARQKAISSEVFLENGDDEEEEEGQTSSPSYGKPPIPTNTNRKALPMATILKKRLRWHALVDSGMGRLGFRIDPVSKEEQGKRRDSVGILKELVDLEVSLDCPIEFFGMCTHMADASSTSTYTNSQIAKFKSLLKRVRAAGISVSTISTDNSAALLTTNLVHFDPKELLTQDFADSRGLVRTGGAIYGQRPSFQQLRAVSTLMASVRHVAVLKKGESVGYDRVYVAPRNVRIATLTMGFADGYPRELGNGKGRVCIRNELFKVCGKICMDMMMVELGPAEEKDNVGAQVVVGDTAILWGPADDEDEGLVRLQDIAAALNTTQSALTCGLNKERVLRQYD